MRLLWFSYLRIALACAAGAMALAAFWILGAESISPRRPYFPMSADEAEMWSAARSASKSAAAIGQVRGDLWTAAALSDAMALLFAPVQSPAAVTGDEVETALRLAERAAKTAPHDSRNWLMLAGLQGRWPKPARNAAEALKLSYYTGPNEFALTPLRLLVAAEMHWDEELQGSVQLEMERVILQRPDLKPAIVTAYGTAMAEEKKFIEEILKQADPALLLSLTASPHP